VHVVGVFVSLVSTRIPFKGTGKEYIGDDISEIRDAVKAALQACCSQLRVKLMLAAAKRQRAGRKKLLVRYIPDVCRAVFGTLRSMSARYGVELSAAAAATGSATAGNKRKRSEPVANVVGSHVQIEDADPERRSLLTRFASGELNDAMLTARLNEAVDKADLSAALDEHAGGSGGIAGALKAGGKHKEDDDEEGAAEAVFISPLRSAALLHPGAGFITHPHCLFRIIPAAIVAPEQGRS